VSDDAADASASAASSSPGPPTTLRYRRLKARYWPSWDFAYHLFPLPAYGAIYVKNPKAACSTVLLWLSRVHRGDPAFDPRNVHAEHGLPTPADLGWPAVMRMLEGGAYRFSVVRDPVRRLESSYHDKIVGAARPLWRLPIQRILGLEEGRIPSFEEFVSAVERQDPATEMDPHWRPQHLNLMHPDVTFDRIAKVEDLAAGLSRVAEETGIPMPGVGSRNIRRTGGGTSVYDGRPDLVERVRSVYAEDCRIYGY
jgi:hypothetical protein